MDFVLDALSDDRRVGALKVVVSFTREALAIDVDQRHQEPAINRIVPIVGRRRARKTRNSPSRNCAVRSSPVGARRRAQSVFDVAALRKSPCGPSRDDFIAIEGKCADHALTLLAQHPDVSVQLTDIQMPGRRSKPERITKTAILSPAHRLPGPSRFFSFAPMSVARF